MRNESVTRIDAACIANLVEDATRKLPSTLRPDYLAALKNAHANEPSERGKEVLAQLLTNADIAATQDLPLCQDTGYVWVCLEVFDETLLIPADVFSGVDAAVERAAVAAGMRMSMVKDALVDRTNTGTNTPAFCELLVASHLKDSDDGAASFNTAAGKPSSGNKAVLHVMLKGGGSDNASALTMLPPGASRAGIIDFVVKRVADKGANACPPLVIGVGVGGSFDKVASLAKHALLREVGTLHPDETTAALESELLTRINELGVGPGGMGGSTTALAVHIQSAPCHIAALPVAVNIGCTALRSISIPL